jgi:phospholipase D1/2
MEQNSGVSYYQAQVALSRQWLGTILPQDEQGVGVRMAIPQANTRDEKSLGAVEAKHSITIKEYPLPKTEDDAKKEIARFEAGAPRSDKDVSDTIGQHAQIDITSLKSEKWLGTEQEEKDA